MISLLLRLVAIITNACYALLKRASSVNENKILFLSRMSDDVPLDFQLVIAELLESNPQVEIHTINNRYRGTWSGFPRFIRTSLSALIHLSTAKVVVLDSYWPHVSVLQHRPELKVFQMWHSLGKVKQSGHQTLGRLQGRNKTVSRAFKLHSGYDYVIASAPAWNPFYVDSFDLDGDTEILNTGLPREDLLRNKRDVLAEKIHEVYPQLRDRSVVLYAPTFRRVTANLYPAHALAQELDPDKYALIVKDHPNGLIDLPNNGVFTCPDFTALELLTVCDYLVTDYSAIAIEAAVADVKTLYYAYDHDHYLQTNGLNLDLRAEMPGCVFQTANELVSALDEPYPSEAFNAYKEKYTLPESTQATKSIVEALFTEGGLCRP